MLRQSCKRVLGVVEAQSRLTSKSISCRLFHENLTDHRNNPRNVGSFFHRNDPDVGTAFAGSPVSGDVVKLQIKVEHNTRKIADVRFMAFGCGTVIASSSLATEWIKGKEIEEALQIKSSEIVKHFSLPPGKLYCSMLAEDAIKAAIKDYEATSGKYMGGSSDKATEG